MKAIEILYESMSDELSRKLRKSEVYVEQLAVCDKACAVLKEKFFGGKESAEFTAYMDAVSELEDIMLTNMFEQGLKLGIKLAQELMEK